MLTDLAKCVLTLLSSPAPGGGPRSQGLRAQQEWVSAAEGQPQTSLGSAGHGLNGCHVHFLVLFCVTGCLCDDASFSFFFSTPSDV